jgi:integrase/recombinase XerD
MRLGAGAHLFCRGKNRKQRTIPLTTQTVKVLTAWLRERAGQPDDPLFPTNRGGPLSRDAVQWLIAKHTATATDHCPSLANKKVTAHVLRHTTAMTLPQSDVSTSVIALWLGHEQESTTRAYPHRDLGLKQRALDRTTPPETQPGRYRASDTLLAFLDSL